MKQFLTALFYICAFGSAVAQDIKINGTDGATIVKVTPNSRIMTVKARNDTDTIFEMQTGACLRGPLSIKDGHGTDLFTLTAGVRYPSNC